MGLGGLIPSECSWDNLFSVRGVSFWDRGGLEEKHLGFSLRAEVHLFEKEYENGNWRLQKPVKIVSRLRSACCFLTYWDMGMPAYSCPALGCCHATVARLSSWSETL